MRMAAHLGEAADALPHEISERLRVARERALDRARQVHPAAARAAATAAPARRSRPEASAPLWMRLAGWLPLLLLILGLIQIQWTGDQEQIDVAAEIDSELLADELPPQAYGDPGFVHFLNRPSEQE